MKSKDLRVIKRIQAEAWGKYGDKLFVEEEKASTMKKVIELSLTKEKHRFTDEQLDKIKNIKESGMLEGTHKVEDQEVAKKFEKYVAKRIKEEIDNGNLSNPPELERKNKQYKNRLVKDKLKEANKK